MENTYENKIAKSNKKQIETNIIDQKNNSNKEKLNKNYIVLYYIKSGKKKINKKEKILNLIKYITLYIYKYLLFNKIEKKNIFKNCKIIFNSIKTKIIIISYIIIFFKYVFNKIKINNKYIHFYKSIFIFNYLFINLIKTDSSLPYSEVKIVIFGKQSEDLLEGRGCNCKDAPYIFNSTPTDIYVNNKSQNYNNY